MGIREPTTPQRGLPRATAVTCFYAVLMVVGFFWHGVSQGSNDVWCRHEQPWLTLLWTPLVGLLAGIVTVQIFRALELRMMWLSELHREFRAIFGRPDPSELLLLAAVSALGEELLFRGAMLDAWGVWVSSLVFALVHIPPRASLWPWTASSLLIGLGLACLTLLTGNLGAAVAAHFIINLLNLIYITRQPPRVPVPRPRKVPPRSS